MATSKQVDGKTPNGGVRSIAYYQDAEGNAANETEATHAEVVELDAEGETIQRTYAELK